MNNKKLLKMLDTLESMAIDLDDCEGILSFIFEIQQKIEGYEIVPIEPTEKMISAFLSAPVGDDGVDYTDEFKWGYRAMIGATQESNE